MLIVDIKEKLMLNPNIEEKLSRTVRELKELSVLTKNKIEEIYFSSEVNLENLNELPTPETKFIKMSNPHVFTEKFKYFWIKASFDIKGNDEYRKMFLSLCLNPTIKKLRGLLINMCNQTSLCRKHLQQRTFR